MIFPSFPHFFRSIGRILRDFCSRKPVLASQEIVNERMDRCDPCLMNEKGQCQACTCLIALKVQFLTEKCFLGRWKR